MVAETVQRAAPTLLSISPFVPGRSAPYAGHRFYFEYLSRLSQSFDVTLLAPDNEGNRCFSRQSDGWRTVLVPPRPKRPGWRGELGTLTLQGREVPVPRLADIFRSSGAAPDVVELQWSAAMSLAPALRRAFPSAYVAGFQHDRYSETLRWGRRSHLTLRGRLRDAFAGRTTAFQEAWVAAHCDLVAAFKPQDISFVRPIFLGWPRTQALLIDPWLDEVPARAPAKGSQDVLFVAAFDRPENIAGASWLLDHVWPTVTASFPRARLVLAGGNPPPSLAERAGPSVLVTGFVEDLVPYYAAAQCFVAPLFAGGGLRFKVPQALCAGIPLVATREALSGLDGIPVTGLAGVSSQPEQFGAAICEVLAEPARAVTKAKVAQAWVMERFSFERQVTKVVNYYLQACGVAGKGQVGRAGRAGQVGRVEAGQRGQFAREGAYLG